MCPAWSGILERRINQVGGQSGVSTRLQAPRSNGLEILLRGGVERRAER